MAGKPLTQERLKELLDYDPLTGVFRWRVYRARGARPGSIAGTPNDNGYILIGIDGVVRRAHRLAWLYINGKQPTGLIDHVNGDKTDNRIANLRLATKSTNGANSKTRCDSSIGLKGVYRNRARYSARISCNGTRYRLGTYDTPELAHAAYCAAARRYFGEFARAA